MTESKKPTTTEFEAPRNRAALKKPVVLSSAGSTTLPAPKPTKDKQPADDGAKEQ